VTTDYGPCGKCGKPMPLHGAMVYRVTWLGKPVCYDCERELTGKASGRIQ
jgi:hypothetical protein